MIVILKLCTTLLWTTVQTKTHLTFSHLSSVGINCPWITPIRCISTLTLQSAQKVSFQLTSPKLHKFELRFSLYTHSNAACLIKYSNTPTLNFSVLKDGGIVVSGTLDGTIVLWNVDEHDITGYLSDPSMKKKRHKDGILPSAAHAAKVCSTVLKFLYFNPTFTCNVYYPTPYLIDPPVHIQFR